MPTLNWIGKDAVVNHHLQVPFHLLRDVPELACGEPGSGNLIVEGDNLVALKALLPYYAGQVKCIYIDPPYNTGNESWVYNDNVNSPVIREWLGKVVGKEGETLDRHDRWPCMMYPRLALLRQFLPERSFATGTPTRPAPIEGAAAAAAVKVTAEATTAPEATAKATATHLPRNWVG